MNLQSNSHSAKSVKTSDKTLWSDQNASPEWRKVLEYYRGLSQQWQREIYLKNLSEAQRVYLFNLLDADEVPRKFEHLDKHLLHKQEYKIYNLFEKIKTWSKYVIGFVVFVIIFLVVLNFKSITDGLSQSTGLKSALNGKNSSAKASDTTNQYKSWIEQFNSVNFDKSENADSDLDGLTNKNEFLLETDPTNPDINKNDKLDGQDILNSTNPLDGKFINYSDKEVTQKYDDIVRREVLNYRLQMIILKKVRSKKQESSIVQNDLGGRSLISPILSSSVIDDSTPGSLTISRLGLSNVPILWGQESSESEISELLPTGLVNYSPTPNPGDIGNSYFAGSSSDYSWKDGKYQNIFDELDKLEPQDVIEINLKLKNGSLKTFMFSVISKNIFNATDEKQFENKPKSEISLSAAWDVGSYDKRLVVKAELVNSSNVY